MLFAEDFRKTARDSLIGYWGVAVGTGFVAGIFTIGRSTRSSSYRNNKNIHDFFHSDIGASVLPIIFGVLAVLAVLALIRFFFGGAITLGYCRFNKNLINGTNPKFNDLFSRFDIFWTGFGMQFLIGLYTALWTLLFIIPGIIAAYSYSMTPYIIDDNPYMGINDAIKYSKQMMDGNKWRLFCLQISFIGWSFLCIFTLGIGYLWLRPYINAAQAAFYFEVSGKNQISEVITEQI